MGALIIVKGGRQTGKTTFVEALPPEHTEYIYHSWFIARVMDEKHGKKTRFSSDMELHRYKLKNQITVFEEFQHMFSHRAKYILKMVLGMVYITITPRPVEIKSPYPDKVYLPLWLRLLWCKDTKVLELKPFKDFSELVPTMSEREVVTQLLGQVWLEYQGERISSVPFYKHYQDKKIWEVL